jgi:hypothetical protein
VLTADPDADLEHALVEWRRFRRRKRLADIHWVDALYQAYVTALISAVTVAVVAGLVSGDELSAPAVDRLLQHAAAWLGVAVAAAIAIGLRSGSRGGPLALERADVRHVLLAPVDRTTALRAPAVRQLRFLLFVAVVAGAIAGDLAAHRLPGSVVAWLASGALFTVTCVAFGYGVALVANGIRLPRWAGTALGVALLVVAVLDATDVVPVSPTEAVGRIALWPITFSAIGLAGLAAAIALLAIGLQLVGNVSLEAAERRSTLVGQLRFAATMQDLRTVIVLRRQLAMELPRLRPWVNLSSSPGRRLPVFGRGLRGVLRWPAARVARTAMLAVVAGVALRGAWAGTAPLVVAAGFAMFLVGLDAIEALAQEFDHPSRRDSAPVDPGALNLRHVPIAALVAIGSSALAAVAAAVPGPGQVPAEVAAVIAVPLALGGVGGALVSVLGGATVVEGDSWNLLPPEVAGMRLALRSTWPPAVAIAGALPVLAARAGFRNGQSAAGTAGTATVGVLALFALVCAWVRMREQIHAWWRAQMQTAFPQKQEEPADA